MKRKLFNLFTFVSLLLFAASVWWWVHSTSHLDQLAFQRDGGSSLRVTGAGGKFVVVRTAVHNPNAKPAGQVSFSSYASDGSRNTGSKAAFTAFSFTSQPIDSKRSETTLILPAWMLALTFALLPSVWLWAKFKRSGGKKKQAAQ